MSEDRKTDAFSSAMVGRFISVEVSVCTMMCQKVEQRSIATHTGAEMGSVLWHCCCHYAFRGATVSRFISVEVSVSDDVSGRQILSAVLWSAELSVQRSVCIR